MVLLSAAFSSCSFLPYSALHYHKNTRKGAYDAVIVPGFPYQPNGNHLITKYRMLWAKLLFEKGIARNVIFSGAAVSTPYVEALVMKKMATEMGIPAANIFAELKAEHSRENIFHSMQLARDLGFSKVAVATDPVQMMFLKAYVREEFPALKWLPIIFENCDKEATLPCIDGEDVLDHNYQHVRERKSKAVIKSHSRGMHLYREKFDQPYSRDLTAEEKNAIGIPFLPQND